MTGARSGAAPAGAWQRVQHASSQMSSDAVRRMQELPWFATLSAEQRSWVGLVVQAGILAFGDWLREPEQPPKLDAAIFGAAPRELARAVSLQQTVLLVRITVEAAEAAVPELAGPGEEQHLRESVLRYSREVAFAAAEVYAGQAEARGAWDARLEAGVVDALVRGVPDDLALSRAATLGWSRPGWVLALATLLPEPGTGDAAHAVARRAGLSLLAGEGPGGLVLVVGGAASSTSPERAVAELVPVLPHGPVVIGPVCPDLASAATSVTEALAGLAAVPGWPQAPRPVECGALLVERVVLGDETARARLLSEIYEPLVRAGGDLMVTAQAFLDCRGSIEATARALFLHPNTVRYRLRKMSDALGSDLGDPRHAAAVRTALVLGRVGGA